jgi:hypothetical protein
MSKKVVQIGLFLVMLASLSLLGGFFMAQKKLGLPIFTKDSFFLKEIYRPKKSELIFSSSDRGDSASENPEGQEISQIQPVASNDSGVNAASPQNSFSFAIIGDTQYFDPANFSGGFQKAIKNIIPKNVDLVMTEGDLVGSCNGKMECEEKYRSWKSVLGGLSSKTYELQGNHDRTGKDKADAVFQRAFDLPTNGPQGFTELAYSFNYKNSHFVILDSEKPDENVINGTQRAWLEQDLNQNKAQDTLVFFHEPAYPVSSKINESLDRRPEERDALWNILVKHRVTAVFNGHEHIASRRNISGVYQFVFGNTDSFNHDAPKPGMAEWSYVGKIFGIVKIEDEKIVVETYSVEGKLLNSFSLVK